MTKPAQRPFPSIEPAALAAVAGGRRSSSSSRSALDDRMTDMLSSIESSIKDLGRDAANAKPDPMSQIMPLVALSMLNQPQQPQAPQVIYVRRRRC